MHKTSTFKLIVTSLLVATATALHAQQADTTTAKADTAKPALLDEIKKSPIKTLTYAQYMAYVNGDDVNNTAAPATMNHYPLPGKVLKYKKFLNLTPEQVKKLDAIMATLKMKKDEVGVSQISNERTLDSLFRKRLINEGTILFYGQRYGAYAAELRIALLTACLKTRLVLTSMQMNKFYSVEKPN
ncbi:hypothetical protein [Mucilaginibacter sp. KACC 22063]|uniref:hypothetical protein n=1 Tax=Mucilaginibacter sp. KACC 22063 TaxID=3025666 RepID=UPI002365A6C9|nr:hypothetical protein [Mucilaginibacter sp. KACC 22063]WDF54853.1 hypothetical protein PQ461_18145 [Mucilaginibacter sp. KACC 22063]